MVIRETLQFDRANDRLTVSSRVGSVCRGSTRWMSIWLMAACKGTRLTDCRYPTLGLKAIRSEEMHASDHEGCLLRVASGPDESTRDLGSKPWIKCSDRVVHAPDGASERVDLIVSI